MAPGNEVESLIGLPVSIMDIPGSRRMSTPGPRGHESNTVYDSCKTHRQFRSRQTIRRLGENEDDKAYQFIKVFHGWVLTILLASPSSGCEAIVAQSEWPLEVGAVQKKLIRLFSM